MRRYLASSKLKSYSYSSIQDHLVQGGQDKEIRVKQEAEKVVEEAASNQVKVVVEEEI